MRFHNTIAVVVGVFFVTSSYADDSTVANSRTTSSHFVGLPRSLTTTQFDDTSTRFLRVEYAADEDDEERGITSALKSLPGANKASALLTKQKLARHLKKDKGIGVVFTKLNLAKNADTLFENPKFLAWVKYVDDFNMKQKDPEKAVSLLPTLTKEFGDAKLARLLDTATKSKSTTTKKLAESLQDLQFKSWKDADLHVDDVFRKLDLNNGLDDILTNPLFLTFNMYLVDFNSWNPSKSTTMVETLARNYGDAKVSKMLEAAMKVDDTSAMATRLQAQQLEGWKNMGLSADAAFKRLGLNVAVEKVLSNPNLNAWVKYMDYLNVNLTRKNRISMIDTFRSNFGDEALSKMLIAAKKDPLTEKVASDMQQSLLNMWVLARKDPNDVSKIVGNSLEGKALYSSYVEKLK